MADAGRRALEESCGVLQVETTLGLNRDDIRVGLAGVTIMAGRKQFQSNLAMSPGLKKALDEARSRIVTEEELREQRISFAFGNALHSESITKESVRQASQNMRLIKPS
jgi:hypothetical protein